MTQQIFDYMSKYGYEQVLLFQNEDVGLRAILAIHSTVLGPAAAVVFGRMRATSTRSKMRCGSRAE